MDRHAPLLADAAAVVRRLDIPRAAPALPRATCPAMARAQADAVAVHVTTGRKTLPPPPPPDAPTRTTIASNALHAALLDAACRLERKSWEYAESAPLHAAGYADAAEALRKMGLAVP